MRNEGGKKENLTNGSGIESDGVVVPLCLECIVSLVFGYLTSLLVFC